jgi:hypothetical protein
MPTETTVERVRLTVTRDIALEQGILLPRGTYIGTRKQIGLVTYQGKNWAPPTYLLELDADQIASVGGNVRPNLVSVEYDVTKYVRTKEIVPS